MPHIFYDWSNRSRPPLLQPHSAAKHEVLEAYLERYVEMLTADPRRDGLRLTIVDGFSGGDMYRHAETGELCAGSPLIFLETVQRMEAAVQAKRREDFRIDAMYYFIDNDASAVSFLISELRKRGYGPLIGERIFVLRGATHYTPYFVALGAWVSCVAYDVGFYPLIFRAIKTAISSFVTRRLRGGKSARGAAGKAPVFGDVKSGTLMPIIKEKIFLDSVVYTDGYRAYDALDVSDFHHFRINHSIEYVDENNRKNHINGIENFWP